MDASSMSFAYYDGGVFSAHGREGASAHVNDFKFDYEEGVSAHFVESEDNPLEHGKGVSCNTPSRRPRRSAAARRAQQERSQARWTCRLLKGLHSIQAHRGNELSLTGQMLLTVLQRSAQNDNVGSSRNLGESDHICRHFSRGRCTYGNACRFSHGSSVNVYDEASGDFNPPGNDDFTMYGNGHGDIFNAYANDDDGGRSSGDTSNPHDSDVSDGDGVVHADSSSVDPTCEVARCADCCKRTRLLLLEFTSQATQYLKTEACSAVDDAIDFIADLDAHDRAEALTIMPDWLRIEFFQNSTVDNDSTSELHMLRVAEEDVDNTLIAHARTALQLSNYNKKFASKVLGSRLPLQLLVTQQRRSACGSRHQHVLPGAIQTQGSRGFYRDDQNNVDTLQAQAGSSAVQAASTVCGQANSSVGVNCDSQTALTSVSTTARTDDKPSCRFLQKSRAARLKKSSKTKEDCT